MEQKGDCADLTTSTTIDNNNDQKYFNELLQEMRQMNRMRAVQPEAFGHAASLLTAEITRVWDTVYNNGQQTGDVAAAAANVTLARQGGRGAGQAPPLIQLQEKILFPDCPSGRDEHGRRHNLIGRILGPNGLSVRQLEAETECVILIRGEGSIKDSARHKRLLGQPGWEHLKEPLHVVVSAKDVSREQCQKKLSKAIKIINKLLSTGNDEYKKQQLIQLAVMNGTYRPGPRNK